MGEAHLTVDIEHVCRHLHDIHDRVCNHWGRVEITSSKDDGGACVLVSKAELESMELALELLCSAPGNDSMCKELTRIADECRNAVTDDCPTFTLAAP